MLHASETAETNIMSTPDTETRTDADSQFLPRVARAKTTRKSVILGDKIAAWTITVGGLLVIFAVIGIMLFLIKVALPLASGGETQQHVAYDLGSAKKTLWLNADEYATIGVRIAADGSYSAFHIKTGRIVAVGALDFGGQQATAVGGVTARDQIAFGFADGTVRFAEINFDIDVLLAADLPTSATTLDEADSVDSVSGAVYRALTGDQIRRVHLRTSVDAPQAVSSAGIVAIAYRVGGTAERPTRSFATIDAQGIGRLSRAESKINMMTGEVRTSVSTSELPRLPGDAVVTAVAMNTLADTVFVSSADGRIFRFDTRNFNQPTLSETVTAFDGNTRVTVMEYLIGEQALLVAGSNGALQVYFRLRPSEGAAPDGYKLTQARSHAAHGAAINDISVSQRSKSLVTEAVNGEVWVRHSTSDQVLFRYRRDASASTAAELLLLPRVDGVLRVGDDGKTDYWAFDFPHPETTVDAVFGEVWYEGYNEPSYTWQSSSGSDVFEPKFSLVPLIFGTLKATVYALLFAIPIALLGAIYTSEFVHRRVRATVKPVMEMMESLPTVVMGFIGALILAPIVESWIAAVMLAFIALPMGLMLAAFLWQCLPLDWAIKLDGIPKFLFMNAVILLSVFTSYQFGPWFEQFLFFGDFKAWTNGSLGSGTPLTFLVLLPITFFMLSWLFRHTIGTRFSLHQASVSKPQAGVLDLVRWLGLLIVTLAVSYALASSFTAMGWDPRGGVVDTYVQRNALIVGFVMGFAIIPNIYTLAEDALNSVPSHIRSASLATGATPWQTAKWVILPTAMSGVFAACMIGMGRAVGETMIVVMAAGNTPVLDWNLFNGLRTLSANIAVELPEAVQDGTLYRMLFLAALTLFAMTFAINTLAESIRMRFRKRAFQL